eukprot:CAMPEP_0176392444 /NCGR_PEP_ID=MMETSP0126-20121128/40871_1 /TAXON_ID=141414 ORGANISM="Strombidinopsis acuminatum, Strain SPMC142" /NCGR_SAMPLE_ID=MMETSP0126 /ASSEMBLY_ACC=CAM_ASM_000229 /LENGTH=59 /DNA_ID=CAMNT_0017763241 /DNA_START=56 /DNA_END=231 /DNA_ORIENTATION=-
MSQFVLADQCNKTILDKENGSMLDKDSKSSTIQKRISELEKQIFKNVGKKRKDEMGNQA